ncbi:MAG: beta-1,6-N-acetylglucosaminyltransferase [Actinomycetota bacterium]|nr:beta-1,6-N-acetylglucosaminyltransferase [Actinomycetota bacterium]
MAPDGTSTDTSLPRSSDVERIAFIVSAYKLPLQLARLLKWVSAAAEIVIVHIDAKTSDEDYRLIAEAVADLPNLIFLPRQICWWGSFSIVENSLKGFSYLERERVVFDHVVYLSGQCYPLRPLAEFEEFLRAHRYISFIPHTPLPRDSWSQGGLDRLDNLYFWNRRGVLTVLPRRRDSIRAPRPGRRNRIYQHLWPFLRPVAPFPRRIPGHLHPFGGGAHWCMARQAVQYVQNFVRQNSRYMRFMRRTLISDEHFFPTILANSPLQPYVRNDGLHFLDWAGGPGWSPKVLATEDLPQLRASGKFFARKFDETFNSEILDLLDADLRVIRPVRDLLPPTE